MSSAKNRAGRRCDWLCRLLDRAARAWLARSWRSVSEQLVERCFLTPHITGAELLARHSVPDSARDPLYATDDRTMDDCRAMLMVSLRPSRKMRCGRSQEDWFHELRAMIAGRGFACFPQGTTLIVDCSWSDYAI